MVLAAACGPAPGYVSHGREGSWQRVGAPAFAAGPWSTVSGLVAPGDGWGAWVAVGDVRDGHRSTAVAWTSADGARWSRSDLHHDSGQESVAAAGARRAGLAVVVGTARGALGDRDGRVWASRDGATWADVPVPAGGPGHQELTSVAGGALGFVAAGRDGPAPAVWWSADGSTWARASGPFLETQAIEAVAVGPQGAVAVGTITTSGDVDGMAWFSPDGQNWRTVPLGGPAGFTGRAEQVVNSVTATAGGFVAVGADDGGERRVAVAWTSADGVTWQREPPSADMADLTTADSTRGITAARVSGAGPVVAVGGSARVRLWSSPDGRRWAREEAPAGGPDALVATDGAAVLVRTGSADLWFRRPPGPWVEAGRDRAVIPRSAAEAWLGAMALGRDGLVSYGTRRADDGSVAPGFWASPDGRRWEWRSGADALRPNGRVDALAAHGDALVAVGVADGRSGEGRVAAVWRSDDGGTTWERIEEPNPAFWVRGATQMFAVTAFAHGLVAVGLSFEATIDAQAWHSADGRTWRRAVEPAAWSGPGDQYFNAVCALPGGGVVAVGGVDHRGEQDAWAWVSQDGVTWERAAGPGAALLGGTGLQYAPSCASTPSQVLVAGRGPGRGGPDGRLWRTTDGHSWALVGAEGPFPSPESDTLVEVAAAGGRIVVTGTEGDDLTVFTSADDGTTWRRWRAGSFEGLGSQFAGRALVAGDEVVLVGSDGASTAVWIGPAS